MPNRTAAILATARAPLIWGSTYLVTTEFLPPNRPFTAALTACCRPGCCCWRGRAGCLGAANGALSPCSVF